jgi:ketosteroid isomerase-like protein
MQTLKNVSFFVFLLLGFSTSLFAQVPVSSPEDEVITLTYKIWKAEMEKNMSEMNKYVSDDYTELNPAYSTRIDGKTTFVKLGDASTMNSGTVLAAEMLNPKVQVYGEIAILSYNYAGVVKGNDGKVTNTKAKSTRVYLKTNGSWKLVHGNFGLDPVND